MNGLDNLENDLSANLKRHDDYLHYINVEYPKQLQNHLQKELIKKTLRDMDSAVQVESEKSKDEATASRRHNQLLFIGIVIPIIILIISLWATMKP